MPTVTLALDLDQGSLRLQTPCLPQSRCFGAADVEQLRAIATDYEHAAHRQRSSRARTAKVRDAELLDVGTKLARWLDGDQRWLARVLEAGEPLRFEVLTSTKLTPEERSLMDAPWELLAHEGAFLVLRHPSGFAPLRRLADTTIRDSLPPRPGALTVLFMAASPRNLRPELNFETEELGILANTNKLPIDLFVEESGMARELGLRARQISEGAHAVHVVHVTGHGVNDPTPALLLEDEVGDMVRTSAEDLHTALGHVASAIGLVFLSACSSAASPSLVHSAHPLALDLVRRGSPAVLGWASSVDDLAASRFAGILYAELARADTSLESALANARGDLAWARPLEQRAWHLPRLFLGPRGGGVLSVSGGERRKSLGVHGAFLGANRRVPVAGPNEFVGRRRVLQDCIAALRTEAGAGLLLHGAGGLGKSSIAARLVDRMTSHRAVVLHGKLTHRGIIEAIAGPRTGRGGTLDTWRERWIARESETGPALRDLLITHVLAVPLLLILDDFEQMLDVRDHGPHFVDAGYEELVRALVDAFAREGGASRLLITSRFEFDLHDSTRDELTTQLLTVPIVSFSARERSKRVLSALGSTDITFELGERIATASHGNPALLSLLLERAKQDRHACHDLLVQAEAIARGNPLCDAKLVELMEHLAVEHIVATLSDDERELLRSSLVFEVPLPTSAIAALGAASDPPRPGRGARLVALGVWDAHPDIGADERAVQVNGLVSQWAARAGVRAPSDRRREAVARAVLPALCQVWGGIRDSIDNLECARAGDWAVSLALSIDDHAALAKFARLALRWRTSTTSIADARTFARKLVEQLDAAGELHDALLLRDVASLHEKASDGEFWERCLARASALAGQSSPMDRASIHIALARAKHRRGDLQNAMSELAKAAELFDSLDSARELALVRGYAADILESLGMLDDALQVRREQELPVHERLGDLHSWAVTQAKIANIHFLRGQYDEALQTWQAQALPALRRTGDLYSWAVSQGKTADISFARGEFDEALRLWRTEQLPIFERLADVRACAIAHGKIARTLFVRGEFDEALRIRQDQLSTFEALGEAHELAMAHGAIAEIEFARGEFAKAFQIWSEIELPAHARLNDKHSWAGTLSHIARALAALGHFDEARRVLDELVCPTFEALGDPRSLAQSSGTLADIFETMGELERALHIRRYKELPIYQQLGDLRSEAIALGQIAGILESQGDLDEGIRIRREQELPIYERLDDVLALIVSRMNLGFTLATRGLQDDGTRALELLAGTLTDARRLGLLDVVPIEDVIRVLGHDPDAPPFLAPEPG